MNDLYVEKSLNNGSLYKMFISDVFGMEMVVIIELFIRHNHMQH